MRRPTRSLAAAACLCLSSGIGELAHAGDTPAHSLQKPAAIVANAAQAPLLSIARAGRRIVAVGDHGVVLLSDDEGAHFRQAHAVPSQALLTSVCFLDDKQGWAAGHDGNKQQTDERGENW